MPKTNPYRVAHACWLALVVSGYGGKIRGEEYVVKAGDTLSEIALSLTGRQPYGAHGSMQQILQLNPQITDPDFIRESWLIRYRASVVDEVAEEPTGERVFIPSAPSDRQPSESLNPQLGGTRLAALTPAFESSETPLSQGTSSAFYISPTLVYSRIDGTDSVSHGTGTLISDLNYGLGLCWLRNWGPRFRTSLSGEMEHQSFAADASKQLDDASQNIFRLGAGIGVSPFARWWLTLRGRLNQALLVRASSTSELDLEKLAVPELGLELRRSIWERGRFNFELAGSLDYAFAVAGDSLSVQHGFSYGGGATLAVQATSRTSLLAEIFYTSNHLDTSISQQTQTDLGLRLSLGWKL